MNVRLCSCCYAHDLLNVCMGEGHVYAFACQQCAVKLNQGDCNNVNNEIELQKPESLV